MSNQLQTVPVDLAERSYLIEIGTDCLHEIGPIVERIGNVTHVIVITDSNVQTPHAEEVAAALAKEDLMAVDLLAVDPGELTKSIDMAAALWNGLLEMKADRKTLIVAVGGGVVGDLAGFVAATYARGIRFLQVPTTLLAQVDSSVGGKVGINLEGAKNMVGAFLQPVAVLIDTETLDTLPWREYRAGLGEVVKYGMILDEKLFERLEADIEKINNREHETLVDIIARSCQLKAEIVRQDEREETGLRAILNYGHTVGHAVETLSGYGTVLHGEGVAIGMVAASRLAEKLGRIDASVTERQIALLEALGLPTKLPELDFDAMLSVMMRDKKVAHGRLRFVLPSRIGHVELVGDIPEATLREALS